MTSEKLRLGVVEMTSTEIISVNYKAVRELYAQAVKGGAEIVVFPENTLFMSLEPGSGILAPSWEGPELKGLVDLVGTGGASLMLTTPLSEPTGKFKNSTILFEPGKPARVVYSKVHLFDVDVKGEAAVRESDHFQSGTGPALVKINGWKFGLSICYDVRFSELYSAYSQKADVILVPSAFLTATGEAHWHVLLRARAIESQAFVAAPAQSGEHISASGSKRRTFGHSLVIDPWGRIMHDATATPGVAVLELERAAIDTVRKQIPMAGHRRLR